MAKWTDINRRKINKAVFLLLQKYHRAFGLAVLSWSRPTGHSYHFFYSLAVRDDNGNPAHALDPLGPYSLSIYQSMVALPIGSADQQPEHPEWRQRELRASELVQWYESQLTLNEFFSDHAESIRWWRRAYHVSQSEPYLLTRNVLGLVSSVLGLSIECYGRGDLYPDDVEYQGRVALMKRMCGVSDSSQAARPASSRT